MPRFKRRRRREWVIRLDTEGGDTGSNLHNRAGEDSHHQRQANAIGSCRPAANNSREPRDGFSPAHVLNDPTIS